MAERGEDAAKRAANGNRYRYRYYTCFSRQRYGTKTCAAERLPADELDEALLQALLRCYEHHDIIDEAVRAAWSRAEAAHQQQRAELESVEAQISKAEQASRATCSPSKPATSHKPNAAPASARSAPR